MAILTGTAGNDTLTGTTGSDTLTGAGGDDTLLGNGGDDVAVFAGAYAGHRFGSRDGYLTVRDIDSSDGDDGVDSLAGVWSLQFGDRTLSVTPGGVLQIDRPGAGGAQLTGLEDGSFVVTWLDNGSLDLLTQRFDAEGSALGTPQLIDATTTEHPGGAAITALPDGGYAIAWTRFFRHFSAGDQARGLYAQRFDAEGNSTGSAVRIDEFSTEQQRQATVCALDDGGFVVAWTGMSADSTEEHVRLQRFDADGNKQGGVFGPDTAAAYEFVPHLALLSGGSVMLAWQAGGNGIRMQRYAEDGSALGTMQTLDISAQSDAQPAIAPLADGGYVLAWMAYVNGTGHIHVQRFDADGAAQGGMLTADATGSDMYMDPAIVTLAGGGFVVAWEQIRSSVFARCYDADGKPTGGVIQPDTYGIYDVTVGALADGGFVLGWSGYDGVQAQRYHADGSPVLPELIGSDAADVLDISGGGALRAIGGAGDDVYRIANAGSVIVELADGGIDRVYSSVRFTLPENVEELRLTGSRNTAGTGREGDELLVGNGGDNRLRGLAGNDTLEGGAGDDTLDGGAGADLMRGGDGDDVYLVDSAGDRFQDFGGGIDEIRSTFDVTLRDGIENLQLLGGAAIGTGNSVANRLRGNVGDNTLAGGAGDDTLEGGGGSDLAVFSGQREDYQFGFDDGVLTVTDLDASDGNDGSDELHQIVRLRFANGDLTLETRGMLPVSANDYYAAGLETIALADGSSIGVWMHGNQVWMQRWNADGTPDGVTSRVAGSSDESAWNPSLARLEDGSYVLSWLSRDEAARTHVMASHYAADGTVQGAAHAVETHRAGFHQSQSNVIALGEGYLVAWTETSIDTGNEVLMAQRFDGTDAPVGESFEVNTTAVAEEALITGTALEGGGFVLSWLSDWYSPGGLGIQLQRFDATGAKLGEETRLTGHQGTAYAPAIAALEGGGYAVAWTEGEMYRQHIMVQRFGAGGSALGEPFLANLPVRDDRIAPHLVALANGNLLVTWYAGVDSDGILRAGRIFDSKGTALGGEIVLPAGATTVAATADGGFDVAGIVYGSVSGMAFDANGLPLWPMVHGSDAADRIDIAGAGAMRASGHAGDDLYLVGTEDVVIELAGGGNDTIEASGSYTLPAQVEVLVLAGTVATNGSAGAGAQSIVGNAAANRLDGGAGDDTLIGGAGDDVYVVDSAVDTVIEQNGAGIDEVQSAVSWTLGTGQDDVRLTGDVEIDATGNTLPNILTGNAHTNILSGGAGNDWLIGGGGEDVARFAGKLADYRVTLFRRDTFVDDVNARDGDDGLDLLSGVPHLRFADTEVTLRVAGIVTISTDIETEHHDPAIAVLADGSYVIAWHASEYYEGSYGIRAQRLAADGTPLGGEFLVSAASSRSQNDPLISALDDGGFVIAWSDLTGDTFAHLSQRYAADGTAIGGQGHISTQATHLTETADGGFATLWFDEAARGGWRLERFDADGISLGDTYTGGPVGFVYGGTDFETLADGGFVAVATQFLEVPRRTEIRLQLFNADGSARGASTRVNRLESPEYGASTVTVLADGSFVVGWGASRDGDLYFPGMDLHLQRYDTTGKRTGADIIANSTRFWSITQPLLSALSGGGFVAAWSELQTSLEEGIHWKVLFQVFDVRGARVGEEQKLYAGTDDLENVYLSGLPDAEFVLGWDGVVAARFAVIGHAIVAPVHGDAGNDVLGVNVTQPMYADGGAGDDLYLVSHSGDTTLEKPGAGVDTVHSVVDWTLAANIEHLVLLDGEAITATGNALPNRVTGNPNANILTGGGGADTLNGAGGNDTLSGGTGADQFVFDTALSTTGNRDLITDFTPGSEKIVLDDDVFRVFDAASSSVLKPGQFHAAPGATAAHDLSDRIVYDALSGVLYYDPDGIGGQSAVQFAQLGGTTHPALTVADLIVVA